VQPLGHRAVPRAAKAAGGHGHYEHSRLVGRVWVKSRRDFAGGSTKRAQRLGGGRGQDRVSCWQIWLMKIPRTNGVCSRPIWRRWRRAVQRFGSGHDSGSWRGTKTRSLTKVQCWTSTALAMAETTGADGGHSDRCGGGVWRGQLISGTRRWRPSARDTGPKHVAPESQFACGTRLPLGSIRDGSARCWGIHTGQCGCATTAPKGRVDVPPQADGR